MFKVVGVRLSVVKVLLAQASDINPEGQVPLSTCSFVPPAPPLKLAPMLDNVMVGLVVCATKEYHTSTPGVPPQVPEVTLGEDWVLPCSVCPVNILEQDVPTEVRDIGELQRSLCANEFIGNKLVRINRHNAESTQRCKTVFISMDSCGSFTG
jgi:hypothetical protein